MSREFALESRFSDGITQVRFGAGNCKSLLAVSSWDSHVRVFEPQSGAQSLVRECNLETAVLTCCWGAPDSATLFGATFDGMIFSYDVFSPAPAAPSSSSSRTADCQLVGQHAAGVRSLCYSAERQALFSGSFDATVACWDVRKSGGAAVQQLQLPGKVLSMDLLNDQLVVGTTGRKIAIYDVRNLSAPAVQRMSPLDYQTRCIKLFPDGSGYVLASIEGRVAMEYFDQRKNKTFAFKCHRKEIDGANVAYPVNCVAFHPLFGTFATGGCDHIVNLWDGANKKRIRQYPAYPTSIAALDFNHDGSLLAIASSYTFEQGEKDSPPDEVYIRHIAETEAKPRAARA